MRLNSRAGTEGSEHSNQNCVACSRRGSAYFVEYFRICWTDFRNEPYVVMMDLYQFSNLSRDVAMATSKYCRNEGKLILRAFFAVPQMEHGFVSLLLARG